MTCWRVNKGKCAIWSSRYAQVKRNCREVNMFLSKLIDMCVSNFCCCFLVIIAAAELPHRHSGEGSIHQRSGGEGGFPGGRGQWFLSYAALVRSWISVQWSTFTFIIRLCLQNREMHDHMEYFLAGQDPPPHTPTERPEVVYRWGATFPHLPFSFSSSRTHNWWLVLFPVQQTAHTDNSDQQGSSLY